MEYTRPQSYNTIQTYDLGEWWDLRGTISMRRLGRWRETHTIGHRRKPGPSTVDNRKVNRVQTPRNERVYRKDLNEIFRRHHSRCVRFPPCFGQTRSQNLKLTSSKKRNTTRHVRGINKYLEQHSLWGINYLELESIWLWHLSIQARSWLRGLLSTTFQNSRSYFFSRRTIELFSALWFLVFGCFAETTWNVGGNDREHFCHIWWSKGPTG